MLNVLVIEDNLDHFALIEDALQHTMSREVNLHHELALIPGLELLHRETFDICLCDLQLPDAPIEVTVEKLQNLNIATPIIVLSSFNSIEVAKSLLQHGVQDYLPKDELSPTLIHRMCIYAMGRKQRQLEMQRDTADMRDFCASLSHDFNGHIRRLRSTALWMRQDMTEKFDCGADDLVWFDHLEQSTSDIRDLVDGLGRFLLVDHTGPSSQDVDLSALFLEVGDLIRSTTDKDFELIIDGRLPTISGSASQLNLLFQNIISNGIKYNQSSPRIRIDAQLDHDKALCHISVTDNGIGIDEKYFGHIFMPFKRLHGNENYRGAGLGLSIAKRIVEQYGGKITVESTVNKGSTFTVVLPLLSRKYGNRGDGQ